MSSIELSPNVAQADNVLTLSAALEMGTEAISLLMGKGEIPNTMQGEDFNANEIRSVLAARLAKKLGI